MNPVAELMESVWSGFQRSSHRFPLAPVRGSFATAGLAIWAIMGAPVAEPPQRVPATERPPEAAPLPGLSQTEQAASWERALARARSLGWEPDRMIALGAQNLATAWRDHGREELPENVFEDDEG